MQGNVSIVEKSKTEWRIFYTEYPNFFCVKQSKEGALEHALGLRESGFKINLCRLDSNQDQTL